MLSAALLAFRLNLVPPVRSDTGRFAGPKAAFAQHPRRPGAAPPDEVGTSAMTGGYVIEVRHMGQHRIRLWCMNRFDEACVFIPELRGRIPAVGDKVFWQGTALFWTAADGTHTNVLIRKLGEAYTPGRETFAGEIGGPLRPVSETE